MANERLLKNLQPDWFAWKSSCKNCFSSLSSLGARCKIGAKRRKKEPAPCAGIESKSARTEGAEAFL